MFVLLLVAVALAGSGSSLAATPTGHLPGVYDSDARGKFVVRPRQLLLICADGNELRLRWRTYTVTKAVAVGTSRPCRGSSQTVTVTVTRVVQHEFTRMTIAFHGFGTRDALELAVGDLGVTWANSSFVADPGSGLRPWP